MLGMSSHGYTAFERRRWRGELERGHHGPIKNFERQ